VLFESRTSATINPNTIDGDELTLSGPGVLDAKLKPGGPVRIGANTYRYFLIDKAPANTTPLFAGAEVVNGTVNDIRNGTKTSTALTPAAPSDFTVTFNAGKFADLNGVTNLAKSEKVILDASKASSNGSNGTFTIGPVVIEKPIRASPTSALATANWCSPWRSAHHGVVEPGDQANTQNQTGGQSSSGLTMLLGGITATFDIALGLPGNFSIGSNREAQRQHLHFLSQPT
jgi:hypothetical protein